MGLGPAQAGCSLGLIGRGGGAGPPTPSFSSKVAAATVWRVYEPTAHPASGGRRGDLKEKEKNRHFAPGTPT